MVYYLDGINSTQWMIIMNNKLKKWFIKKMPQNYDYFRKFYHFIIYLLERYLIGTFINETIWKYKHFLNKNFRKEVNNDGINNMSQIQIVKTIKKFNNVNSLIDIGFGLGVDLKAIRKNFKFFHLYGIDINFQMVSDLKVHFKKNNDNRTTLYQSSVYNLAQIQDKQADILLSNAVLMFIGPDKIHKAIKEFERVTNKIIILNEYNYDKTINKISKEEKKLLFGSNEMYYKGGRWIYNYKKLFEDLIPNVSIKTFPSKKNCHVKDDWSIFGSLLVIELNKD